MKNILIFFLSLLLFSSCHNYKKDAEQLTIVRDSLEREAAFKDSSIVMFLNDFNEILVTLDSIKKVEKLVTVQSARGSELSTRQKKQIMEDIALLNELIQKNKEKIASLQKKLSSANYKIRQLNEIVAELEQLVINLEKQVQEKDTEIVALSEEVNKLTRNINTLNLKITEIETESQEKTNTIELQKLKLNEAYFTVGTRKELKEKGIIEKSGGLLGIGSTTLIKDDFDRKYFTEIDIRKLDYIPLMVKRAELVSVHPAHAYHISGKNRADTLFIDNKTEFWEAARILVIVTN
ncbi:MAG: hypothetical protein ABFS16_04810 [Bacteroidota bacterium]